MRTGDESAAQESRQNSELDAETGTKSGSNFILVSKEVFTLVTASAFSVVGGNFFDDIKESKNGLDHF